MPARRLAVMTHRLAMPARRLAVMTHRFAMPARRLAVPTHRFAMPARRGRGLKPSATLSRHSVTGRVDNPVFLTFLLLNL